MANESWQMLPPNMQSWNNAVIDNITMKLPEITSYISGISWSKLDPGTGDADGIIQLVNGMCAAPVTIRAGRLAPIDIIVTNYGTEPKFYPLSATFLQKIYADNIMGEPVDKGQQTDEDYEGPGVRIKNIKTVDAVKYASVEAANSLLNEIVKSAKVSEWMAENMPETIVALSNRAAEINEKLASTKDELGLPDLMVVWKEGNNFYANNNLVDSTVISDFCKMANATIEERTNLMNGVPIVRDYRDKVAAIHIPTEQEAVAIDLEDENVFADAITDVRQRTLPDIALTTAYLKDGSSRRGIIFSKNALLNYNENKDTVKNLNPQDITPEIEPVSEDVYARELFVCSDGYGFNTNIKTDVRVPLSLKVLKDLSTITDPAVGMVGLFIETTSDCPCGSVIFGRVEDVIGAGNTTFIRIYNLLSHKLDTVKAGVRGMTFYECTDDMLPVVSNQERTDYVSMTGINGILTLNDEGRLVLDGESHTIVNCPYALMSKYASAYEDAVKIVKIAKEYGRCEFTAQEPLDKTAAVGAGQVDKTKNNKNTKAGTDDEQGSPEVQQDPMEQQTPQLATTTPEAMMSVNLEGDPEYGFGMPGAGQVGGGSNGVSPVGNEAGYTQPISSKDLENVVALNSPKVMDAYVMAGLAQGQNGLTSQENIMRTSNTLVSALEHLSKLLFLTRQGTSSFINELDIQAAMQKLTEVAEQLGLQTSTIAQ